MQLNGGRSGRKHHDAQAGPQRQRNHAGYKRIHHLVHLVHLVSLVCLVHLVCLVDLAGRFNQINKTNKTNQINEFDQTIASSLFESQSGEIAPDRRSEQVREMNQETESISSISTGAPRGNSAAPTATRA